MTDEELRELKADQMALNIEKMRADMRWEARKFMVSAILAVAAAVGAGAALGSYLTKQSQPIIIQMSAPTPASPGTP